MTTIQTLEIAFYCQENGIISEILTDSFGIISGNNQSLGKLFQNLTDEASREKAFEFLVAVKRGKFAIDDQMNFRVWHLDFALWILHFW